MHDEMRSEPRRKIPAVSAILEAIGEVDLPRPIIVDIIRNELNQERKRKEISPAGIIVHRIRNSVDTIRRSRLATVINGTGIIIHTNLGRAPIAPEAAETVGRIAASYANLEQDLTTGARGSRAVYVERAISVLCGSESATVVNNCAAALVLIAHHFTKKKAEIVISRGEMVQIGGGFRIGDILENAGARLREVGATNKTTLEDYERAIGSDTAFLLKVHRSNFFMTGFVGAPSSAEVAVLARRKRVPFVQDLGSGAMFDTRAEGLEEHEPTPAEAIKEGADLVCFSGDKLFGGPQSGIIAGRKRWIDALRKEPLFRALRCDKLVLAALQTTVDLHLRVPESNLPVRSLLRLTKDELRARAAAMLVRLRGLPLQITIGRGSGNVGGGSLAQSVIPSVTLDIVPEHCSLKDFAARLRRFSPPIVGYVANGSVKLDLRTIFPSQDDTVVDAIRVASANTSTNAT
jgi:L-seryl-tRNA(Ser) seleniumtransferase